MHTRQYLPFERMSEFFSDVCNLKISQGTLCTLLKGFAQKAQPAYELITHKGENEKAVIRLETDTCIKNGQNVLAAFKTIAVSQPEKLQNFNY